MPWLPLLLCVWCAMYFFQLVKIMPHRPWSPDYSHTYLSVPSLSKRGVVVLSIKVSHSFRLENAAVRMSLKSVRWNASLTSSSSKIDTTEKYFSSQISKKSSVPDNPSNKCKSSEKATAYGFAVDDKKPSIVNVCASSGSCPHIAAIVCWCAWLCSVIATISLVQSQSPLVLVTLSICVKAGRWSGYVRGSHSLRFRESCPSMRRVGIDLLFCPTDSVLLVKLHMRRDP